MKKLLTFALLIAGLNTGKSWTTSDIYEIGSNQIIYGHYDGFTIPILCAWSNVISAPTIPAAQIQSDWSETNNGSLGFIKNKPSTQFTAGTNRTLNASFQASTTNNMLVNYSVDVNATATLIGGQDGRVILETSPNNSTWTTVDEAHNGNSVSLAIALTAIQNVSVHLSSVIPSGYWIRIRTVQTTGTPSFTFRFGNETSL